MGQVPGTWRLGTCPLLLRKSHTLCHILSLVVQWEYSGRTAELRPWTIEPAGTEFLLGLLDYVFDSRTHKERTLLPASPRPRRGKESVHGEKNLYIYLEFSLYLQSSKPNFCVNIHPVYYNIAYAISPSNRTLGLDTFTALSPKLVSSMQTRDGNRPMYYSSSPQGNGRGRGRERWRCNKTYPTIFILIHSVSQGFCA